MDAKIITDLNHFEPWGNAKDILEKIEMAGKMNELDQYISEMYPDGITGSDLNDLIGIEHDELLQQLGIYDDIYGGEDDVIPQEESFNFNSLNKTLKKAITEFYDVVGMDSIEMEIVNFGDGRYELDGIEFYLGEDETLENAVDTCIEMEFFPEWEEQGLSSYNVDSVKYDEEEGRGTAYVGLFWDEEEE